MTAVASPPSISHLPRPTWSDTNGSHNNMNTSDEPSRVVIPRKSAQRPNSIASLPTPSIASSTSTATAATATNTTSTSSSSSISSSPSSSSSTGASSSSSSSSSPSSSSSSVQVASTNGDTGWTTAAKKKPTRGLWPPSKSEAVAGISIARPHSVPAASSGQSAATAISALHMPLSSLVSQQMPQTQPQMNGVPKQQGPPDLAAFLQLVPINGTFDKKTITLPFGPEAVRVGRQTNQKTLPTASNGYFDSKVLSRQHAEIWAERDGRVFIKDVKSSNGTFINGKRLSAENKESEPHQLKEQDVLELGIDIVSEDQKSVIHHKVAARVEHAGINRWPHTTDLNFGDLDPSTGVHNHNAGTSIRGRPIGHGIAIANPRIGQSGTSNSMASAGFHAKWLQPITMEQVVKRLNSELRQARLQSQDLHYTNSFVEAVRSVEKLTSSKSSGDKSSSPHKQSDSVRSRFATEPPAPPPSQPLPEAPASESVFHHKTADNSAIQPLLKRSDTEKPTLVSSTGSASANMSPIKTDATHQILNLIEALTSANKEITTQSEKLKEMEEALHKEREERKSVEEKMVLLENGALASPPALASSEDEVASEPTIMVRDEENAQLEASELQKRVDFLRAEMDSMRSSMEDYRQRAEKAEEDSHRDRKCLSEMVESLRKREEAARRRRERKRAHQISQGTRVDEHSGTVVSIDADDTETDILDEEIEEETDSAEDTPLHDASGRLERLKELSPSSTSVSELPLHERTARTGNTKQLTSAGELVTRSTRFEPLTQSAPYASLIGVVLLGVGMMAYLNGWQNFQTER